MCFFFSLFLLFLRFRCLWVRSKSRTAGGFHSHRRSLQFSFAQSAPVRPDWPVSVTVWRLAACLPPRSTRRSLAVFIGQPTRQTSVVGWLIFAWSFLFALIFFRLKPLIVCAAVVNALNGCVWQFNRKSIKKLICVYLLCSTPPCLDGGRSVWWLVRLECWARRKNNNFKCSVRWRAVVHFKTKIKLLTGQRLFELLKVHQKI